MNRDVDPSKPGLPVLRLIGLAAAAVVLLLAGYMAQAFVAVFNSPSLGEHVLPAMVAGEWRPESVTETAALVLAPEGEATYPGAAEGWWFIDDASMQVVDRRPSGNAYDPVSVFTARLRISDTSSGFELEAPIRVESRSEASGTVRRMTIESTDEAVLPDGFPRRWTIRD